MAASVRIIASDVQRDVDIGLLESPPAYKNSPSAALAPEPRGQSKKGQDAGQKPVVGVVEALSHPTKPVRRLLEKALTWANDAPRAPEHRPRSRCRTAKQLHATEIDALVRVYQQDKGATVYTLARQFGISQTALRNQLHRAGIPKAERYGRRGRNPG
ncbi:hypothetical protein GCM10017788_10890 [Amycolatopsis acidiphila]|nr:hypothetical protein GCM10017788_10890 [Amycolatopsis acidiphila]